MIEVNYIAILLAAVSAMVVGFFWYSPMLFGKPWMKMMGLTKKSMEAASKEMGKTYTISFITGLITAFVLSHVMAMSTSFYGYEGYMSGLSSAFWMWLGFVMPVQMTYVLFGKEKQWGLFAINTGYQLVALMAMGLVIGIF